MRLVLLEVHSLEILFRIPIYSFFGNYLQDNCRIAMEYSIVGYYLLHGKTIKERKEKRNC